MRRPNMKEFLTKSDILRALADGERITWKFWEKGYIMLSFERQGNFRVVDSTGMSYPLDSYNFSNPMEWSVYVPPSERKIMAPAVVLDTDNCIFKKTQELFESERAAIMAFGPDFLMWLGSEGSTANV
jgi:hypothetical protein